MKIFKLNDSDWVAADTLEDAKKCLADTVALGKVNAEFEEEFIESPRELSDFEMNNLFLRDEEPEDEEEVKKETFRVALDRMLQDGTKFPTHFASSEY